MLPREAELVSDWTGLSGRAKSVKRFERSNGLDAALHKNYLYFVAFQRSKRTTDDGEILSEYSDEDEAPRRKKRGRKGSESDEENGERKGKKRRRFVFALPFSISHVLLSNKSRKCHVCNLLSVNVKSANTVMIFCHHLKRYVFNLAHIPYCPSVCVHPLAEDVLL